MESRKPSPMLVTFVSASVAFLIMFGVLILKVDIHAPILLSTCLVIFCGVVFLKMDYRVIEQKMIDGVMVAMQSILILWTVGVVIGTWITAGIVPSMIYYGLKILSPSIFLFASFFICSVVSLATGTSWGTIGTIGLSLLGISIGLGIPAPMVVGAVVSGSYFGDKMSPLSDTTILAPAVAGTDLFLHIKAMIWTTGPSYLIISAILIYFGFGFADGSLETQKIQAIMKIMEAEFWINPITLLVPAAVILLSARKKPSLPSLWTGVFMALAMMVFQGKNLTEIFNSIQWGYTAQISKELLAGADSPEVLAKFIADSGLNFTPEIITGAAKDLVKLVNRGGMQSMNWTASLMVIALVFGSAMEACGFFTAVVEAIIKRVKTVPGLITATGISSVLGNAFLGDAYLSIVVPGRIFKPAFEEMGLHPRMLSRTLEDFGTLTAGAIPWCTGGVFIAGTLGVPTLEYLPYAHLLWINPLVAIIITYMGIGIFWSGKDGESVKGGKTKPVELMEK